jgi:hypothetical protein
VRKLVLVLVLGAFALAASAGKKFDSDAVWQPKPSDQEKAWADMRQCGAMMAGGSPGSFEACTGEAMRKHGASEAAIAFNKATGGNAYATRFTKSMMGGTVDIMEALNPFQANSSDQIFFVNGEPAAVSADEQAMKLDTGNDPSFQAVRKMFPNAFLFPHVEPKVVAEAHGRESGQSFTLAATILDGCHACARLGVAQLQYDFDKAGRFLGVKIRGIIRAGG